MIMNKSNVLASALSLLIGTTTCSYADLLVHSGASLAFAREVITEQQAKNNHEIVLRPYGGKNIELPEDLLIYKYWIDDDSVAKPDQGFHPRVTIFRITGQQEGTTKLSMLVQRRGEKRPFTLNFRILTSSSQPETNGPIEVRGYSDVDGPEDSYPTQFIRDNNSRVSSNQVAVDLARQGVKIAIERNLIKDSSVLHKAIKKTLIEIEKGVPVREATAATGVRLPVLRKLMQLGSQSSDPAPIIPIETNPLDVPQITASKKTVKVKSQEDKGKRRYRETMKEIAALKKQLKRHEAILKQHNQQFAQIEKSQRTFLAKLNTIEQQGQAFLAQLDENGSSVEKSSAAKSEAVQVTVRPETEAQDSPPAVAHITTQPQSARSPRTEAESNKLTPLEKAHAIKKSLGKYSTRQSLTRYRIRQVNSAIRRLKRNQSMARAAKASGVPLALLEKLSSP